MTQLRLTCDDASTFKNAVRVFTLDGAMVGHVAAEHVKLVSSWINFNDYSVFILPCRIQCLPSKTQSYNCPNHQRNNFSASVGETVANWTNGACAYTLLTGVVFTALKTRYKLKRYLFSRQCPNNQSCFLKLLWIPHLKKCIFNLHNNYQSFRIL